MSIRDRLRRIETKFEAAPPGELPAPVSEEHAHVRERMAAVESDHEALPPEEEWTPEEQVRADVLIDEWLDLSSADYWISSGLELPQDVEETLSRLRAGGTV